MSNPSNLAQKIRQNHQFLSNRCMTPSVAALCIVWFIHYAVWFFHCFAWFKGSIDASDASNKVVRCFIIIKWMVVPITILQITPMPISRIIIIFASTYGIICPCSNSYMGNINTSIFFTQFFRIGTWIFMLRFLKAFLEAPFIWTGGKNCKTFPCV